MDLNDLTPEQIEMMRRRMAASELVHKRRKRDLWLKELNKGDVIHIPAEPGLHHSSRIARNRRIVRQDEKALAAFMCWKGVPPEGIADILREDEDGFLTVLRAARQWVAKKPSQGMAGRNVRPFETRSAGTNRYSMRKLRTA